jgi:N-methylhydantoinase A/oxoprolinase/acetone carboxylase beta subunit
VRERFESAHERLYGTRLGDPVEIVDCWVTMRELAPVPEGVWSRSAEVRRGGSAARWLALAGGDVPVHWRSDLEERVEGPCLVEEERSVTLVPAGATARVERSHLIVELGA